LSGLPEGGLAVQGQQDSTEIIESARSVMMLDEPSKGFIFAEVVLDTGKAGPTLSACEFPTGIAVEDRPVLCDYERVSECQVTQPRQDGQTVGRNGEIVADVRGV
jgi:hypothetical protein